MNHLIYKFGFKYFRYSEDTQMYQSLVGNIGLLTCNP